MVVCTPDIQCGRCPPRWPTVSCPPWGVKAPRLKCPMASLATEDGVQTMTALRLHGTPTAIQTQFKRNSLVRLWRDVCGPPSSELASLVCGPLDPSAPWGPWPHRTTTARHPNRYSNAIQTVELQIQCRGNAILCVVVVCVWLVCGPPRWEYSVLLPPVPCEDDVNTLPCTPPFPNRGSNGRRLS